MEGLGVAFGVPPSIAWLERPENLFALGVVFIFGYCT